MYLECSLNGNVLHSHSVIEKTYDLTAVSKFEDVSIAGHKILHKKVLKEKNGWRTMVLVEYRIS